MKSTRLLLASTLIIGLTVISGCANSTSSSKQNPTSQTTSNQTATPTAIHSGAIKMLSITETLKAAINNGDDTTVKTTGPQLEDAWSPFEDNVKQKYPDLYKKIEDYLDPTIAGSKATPMDKQTLGTLNGELTKALKELSTKE
jgi:iron uptake system EfeUOB component EfeO/EfeM